MLVIVAQTALLPTAGKVQQRTGPFSRGFYVVVVRCGHGPMPHRDGQLLVGGSHMSRRATMLTAALVAGAAIIPSAAYAVDTLGSTELVSVSSAGVQGDQDSQSSSISGNGRFVAFASLADNLVPGDTNNRSDIFVRDRLTGTTERVSVSSAGREGDDNSGLLNGLGAPSISADGRFVAFDSFATNLVKGDRNNAEDVFVHDRVTGTTTRVSVTSTGGEASGFQPTISADGRFVAFLSRDDRFVPDQNFTDDVFLHDRQTGVTERISQAPDGSDANGQSFGAPLLSAHAEFVYFTSAASNLTTEADPSTGIDAFLFDRQTQTMTTVSREDGTPVDVNEHGVAEGISGNGRFLTFTTQSTGFLASDANGFTRDAFLVDRQTGARTLLSVNDAGDQADDLGETHAGPVSDDGRFVAMVSQATNFGGPTNFRENVYLRDVEQRTTRLVSAAVAPDGTNDLDSIEPAMTPDGSAVSFSSRSELLGPENQSFFAYDIFVRDLARADLALTMNDSPDPVRVRGQLTYSLTVSNGGPATATNVALVDTLPAATFVSATPAQGTCVRGGKSKTDGTLTCELGSLAAGQTTTVTVVVSPTKVGSLSNTATVSADQIDPDTADNSATATTTVVR